MGAFYFSSILRSTGCASLTIRFTEEWRMLRGCYYYILCFSGTAVTFDHDKHGINPKKKQEKEEWYEKT
jgi:hypothetical protein